MTLFYTAPDISRPSPEDLLENLLVKMEQTGARDADVLRGLGLPVRSGSGKASPLVGLPTARLSDAVGVVVGFGHAESRR